MKNKLQELTNQLITEFIKIQGIDSSINGWRIQIMPPQNFELLPEAHQRWCHDKGDEILRYDYDLNPRSVVFDVGGFEGGFADKIYDKFNCNVYVFEPIEKLCRAIRRRKRFCSEKITVFCEGLSNKTEKTMICEKGDGSSTILTEGGCLLEVQMTDINEVISRENIPFVDLIKINIEGGEFDLLEHMISTGTINRFYNIQVQFHTNIENCKDRYDNIREELSKTHELEWCYEWVWESWKTK
jgi:FkbM family methyltransferase